MKTAFLILALCFFSGCERNFQLGNYAVSTEKSIALSEQLDGELVMLQGRQLDDKSQPIGKMTSLVNLLVLNQSNERVSSERDISHGKFVSNVKIRFESTTNPLTTMDVSWNRATDEVVVQDERFDRKSANSFLVIVGDGGIRVVQINSNFEDLEGEKVIAFIRENSEDEG